MPHKDVIVIGGGIGGLCAAYFLRRAGLSVTVVESGDLTHSASCGNAGYLSIFEKSPFAYPGVFRDTFRALLKNRSPMVFNPTIDMDFVRWAAHFWRASSAAPHRRALAIFEHFGEQVFQFYEHLSSVDKIDCDYRRDGFALLYTDESTYRRKLNSVGPGDVRYKVLSRDEIGALCPLVKTETVAGAIVLKRNGQVDPARVVTGLHQFLKGEGVEFVLNTPVSRLVLTHDRVTAAVTPQGDIHGEQFVLATGASQDVTRQLDDRLIMTPGRGYSATFSLSSELTPKIPFLFSDIYTAITPRRHDLRVTGRIEFGRSRRDPRREAERLLGTLHHYTHPFDYGGASFWSGERPLTSNDMPYLGRSKRFNNAVYLTGLGHTGMNLGPIAGRIVSEVISRNQQNVDNGDLLLLSRFYNE